MKVVFRFIRQGSEGRYYKQALRLLTDVRCWIVIVLLASLPNITNPPLDDHTWRQALTIMIAKNFHEISPNIMYPRMDIGGETDGIIAVEFPVFNYLLAGLYYIFGYDHWYGRAVNMAFALLAVWFFYLTMIKLLNQKQTALFASLALLASVYFEYARKTMPDSFSMSLVITGVYFAWHFLDKQKIRYLALGAVLFAFGILSKIPAICYATVLIVPLLNTDYRSSEKLKLIGTFFVACLLMLAWYFYWMPYLLATYKNQLIWPVSLFEGFSIFWENLNLVYIRFEEVFYMPYLLFLTLLGLVWFFIENNRTFKLMILAYLTLFFLYVFKTGIVFPTHTYYTIPIIPLMAVSLGNLLSKIPVNHLIKTIFVIGLLIPAWLQQNEKAKPWPDTEYLLTLQDIVDEHIPLGGKIMVNSGQHDPTLMFFAGRRGWSVNNDILSKYTWMPDFKLDGLTHIVVDRRRYNEPLDLERVFINEDFVIYKP